MGIYLPVTIGGGAENRTPVHESPLIGISKLSRWFNLGRLRAATRSRRPNRFGLSPRHTDYVRRSIPLK